MGAVSAAMGLVSLFGASREAKAAKKAAKAEAASETRVTQEKVFQLKQQERRLAGETRARVAGSGVKVGTGSPLDVLAEQASTFARERLVTQQMGAERAGQAMQRGKSVAQAAMFRGVTGALSAFGAAGQARATTGSMFKFGT